LFAQSQKVIVALAGIVESTLAGMGFELVDTQVSGGGRLLRIFVDRPAGRCERRPISRASRAAKWT